MQTIVSCCRPPFNLYLSIHSLQKIRFSTLFHPIFSSLSSSTNVVSMFSHNHFINNAGVLIKHRNSSLWTRGWEKRWEFCLSSLLYPSFYSHPLVPCILNRALGASESQCTNPGSSTEFEYFLITCKVQRWGWFSLGFALWDYSITHHNHDNQPLSIKLPLVSLCCSTTKTKLLFMPWNHLALTSHRDILPSNNHPVSLSQAKAMHGGLFCSVSLWQAVYKRPPTASFSVRH